MKIYDIERKETNFGCLEYGDVFELNDKIFMKASVELSASSDNTMVGIARVHIEKEY